MKIVYFGLPLGACLLCADNIHIDLAVLSPVAAPGRRRLASMLPGRRIVDARSLAAAAVERQVDASFSAIGPVDLIVTWYYTRRLPQRWLEAANQGAIGAHPSLLPRHRGPNPFFWTIDTGDDETGVTIFRLTEDYDDGPILLQEPIPVLDRDSWQLARALDRPSLRLLRNAVIRLSSGRSLPETPQDESKATWAPEPEGDLLRVDWSWPVDRVLRRIRALSPIPGLAIRLQNDDLFVTRAGLAKTFPAALDPGEAAVAGAPPRVVIRAGDGAVTLEQAVSADGGSSIGASELAERLER